MAGERGGSTSDILNELLLETAEYARPRRLEVLSNVATSDGSVAPAVTRFRVLPGGGKPVEDANPKIAHELERLRDALAGVLAEIETLMAEQLNEDLAQSTAPGKGKKASAADMEYASGFRAGMLEALETTYALLQAELLISEHV